MSEQPKPVLWYPISLSLEATKAFWNGEDVQPFIDKMIAEEKGKRQQWKGRWYTTVDVMVDWISSEITSLEKPALTGVAHREPEDEALFITTENMLYYL